VDNAVDCLCRHAVRVVHDLWTTVWIRRGRPVDQLSYLRRRNPPGVRERKFAARTGVSSQVDEEDYRAGTLGAVTTYRRPASNHDRAIPRLAVPAFGALVAEPLYLRSDPAIVGHQGSEPLGGLGVAGQALS